MNLADRASRCISLADRTAPLHLDERCWSDGGGSSTAAASIQEEGAVISEDDEGEEEK
jgi:hypothetical protein